MKLLRKILHIEDDALDRDLVSRLIGRLFDIDSVATLHDGLKLLAERNYDAVLLDTQLPDCDRDSAVAAVKKMNNPAVVLVLTGHSDPSFLERAIRDSAAACMIKGHDDRNQSLLSELINSAIAFNDVCQKLKFIAQPA